MNTNLIKIFSAFLTLILIVSQVGCGDGYPEECFQNGYYGQNPNSSSTFNSQDGTNFFDFGLHFDLDIGKIDVNAGSASEITSTQLSVANISSKQTLIEIGNLPLNSGEKKVFNIEINSPGYMYTIENNFTDKRIVLPPTDAEFTGWANEMQFGFQILQPNFKRFTLDIYNEGTMAYNMTSFGFNQLPVIDGFPQDSISGQFKISREISETWTGTMTFEVLKNEDNEFQYKATYEISDGTNTYEQIDQADLMLSEKSM